MNRYTIARVEDLFDSLDREKRVSERRIVVRGNTALEKMVRTFEQCLAHHADPITPYLTELVDALDGELRAEEIYAFSQRLGMYEDHSHFSNVAGSYLSGLARHAHSDEQIIRITTKRLSDPTESIRNLSLKGEINNRRQLIVEGDVDMIGTDMDAGELIVEGTVYGGIGFFMEGGNILVKGDVHNDYIGAYQNSGQIQITGTVHTRDIGCNMSGGSIRINGNVLECDNMGRGMEGGVIDIRGALDKEVDIGYFAKRGHVYHNGEILPLRG